MKQRTEDAILALCVVVTVSMPIFGVKLVKLLIDENRNEIGLTIGIVCLAVWVVCMFIFTEHARKGVKDE